MWGRRSKPEEAAREASALKEAVREARIEAAERSAVVVDLRDAEVARLELLNDALDPVFADLPSDVELFDRGVSRGDVPRLWVDVVAHVEMGRDKRKYRFVQETRYGRAVLAESYEIPEITQAVTRYVARRLVERERALTSDAERPVAQSVLRTGRRRGRLHSLRIFVLGVVLGAAALFAAALLTTG
jgi:CRP-like cAMP-binding protein